MAIEVVTQIYKFLPPTEILKSQFDLLKGHVSTGAICNLTPSTSSSRIEKDNLLVDRNISTSTMMVAENNSTLLAKSSPVILEGYSTQKKGTRTPDELNLTVTKSRSAVIGDSDPPEPEWYPFFWANYIHDLESLWCILIWILFKYREVGGDKSSEDYEAKVGKRAEVARRLFDIELSHLERLDILKCAELLYRYEEITPHCLKELIAVAVAFSEKLQSAYTEEEGKAIFPIKLMDDGLLHQDILKAFRSSPINDAYIDDESTIASEETSVSSKRPICEDSPDKRPLKRARY